ncbi:MAG: ACT domain-containing protein, partial [Calditrichaeota bacterium]|nr:ACT domain-containing protein [Calditrichota bacterium]
VVLLNPLCGSKIDPGLMPITVGGYGMVGVPGIAAKIFSAVRDEGANVLMISQSSAEHNITFVIRNEEVPQTVASLEKALTEWIEKDHRIDRVRVVPEVAIITVVGENMRGRYGIAGKVFSALGRNKINVVAIAQGSSEYSISMVLKAADRRLAVDAIHAELDEENGDY